MLTNSGFQVEGVLVCVGSASLLQMYDNTCKTMLQMYDNTCQTMLLDPIRRLEWAHQTTIFRLHTGHCGLRAHLKRTGVSDTFLCECGQADQTPDHVLQSCPKYAESCQLTWPHGADLATKLWSSAEDLYRTAGFVASTGLKI